MGEFIFVPGNDFNQQGGDSGGNSVASKFTVSIRQECNPYKLYATILGEDVIYQYKISSNGVNYCLANINYPGNAEFEIPCGASLLPGNSYTLEVSRFNDPNTPKEYVSFQKENCSVTWYPEYCCGTGLSINGAANGDIILIQKGAQSETVTYPFAVPIHLADGDYTVSLNGVPYVDTINVYCKGISEAIASCNENSTADINIYMFGHVTLPNAPCAFETWRYDVKVKRLSDSSIAYDQIHGTDTFGYEILGNENPNDTYEVEFNYVGLNNRNYLGVFTQPPQIETITIHPVSCLTYLESNYLKITNIRCDKKGILLDLEVLNSDNISFIGYVLVDKNGRALKFDDVTYNGSSPKRTLLIRGEDIGWCMNDWSLLLKQVEGTYNFGNNAYVILDNYVYIPELFKSLNCLNCNWPYSCFDGQST